MAEPVTRVHPRIRARRVEVRREAGRRRLRLVVGGLTILATAAAGWGLTRSALLDVDRIAVAGLVRTDPASIAEAAGLRTGAPMVDIDAARVEDRLERLPWVATASVRREWPGTLDIAIVEREAAAVVAFGERWVLADASGRVLAPAAAEEPVLARVIVVEGDPPPPGEVITGPALDGVQLAAAATGAVGDRVDAVTIDEHGQAVLTLAGGVDALMGPATELEAKLTALATLLGRVDLRGVTTIDLRVPSAPVLTRA